MSTLMRRANLGLNVGIVVLSLALAGMLVKQYAFSDTGREQDQTNVRQLRYGERLALRNVDWKGNGQTLVMALSRFCNFCTESAPFYQKLAQNLSGQNGVKLVAVMPHRMEESRKYLEETLGLRGLEVRESSLRALGVEVTPTLILVNGDGAIGKIWTGKLNSGAELEVLDQLRLMGGGSRVGERREVPVSPKVEAVAAATPAPGKAAPHAMPVEGVQTDGVYEYMNMAGIERATRSGRRVVILDVRDRAVYAAQHLPGARNIPVDELEVRAGNELSPADVIVTYSGPDDSRAKTALRILKDQDFNKVFLFTQ